ncbi:class Ib ribonucleoside-diphosphate reductase assembly flavoprotein NrdI [Massilibacteroides sp.]|uniref:class Ib ribonucleoside-diphosphate reductase assembly flavoprotein NrdI n=1 Tax=Massilibacteroides sp. TaxID=2034766 RepID=UPI00260DA600|nr:class Ib ribonucleoside-diphosphate reductase assembly flavoprotein NrdI [Massilibacteroides sp.]MDD4514695.1 class Ib ribonucleoside-diphosphate reductase assembly flavoprotein NrdI [Massilibacteroides sp.]
MYIYYDSRTGNVERFIQKIKLQRDWHFVKISQDITPQGSGHLITYTTNFGDIPRTTFRFMEDFGEKIKSVSSSGNMNWGKSFGLAADKIAEQYHIPLLLKFELSGLPQDVQALINRIEEISK